MAIQKNPHNPDTTALSRINGYDDDSLIITDGVEILTKTQSTVYSFPFGEKLDMQVGIDFFKGGLRPHNKPGTYCINLYYGTYVARDCVVDRRNPCACKRGEFFAFLF